jgi:hypothetical protein
VEKLQQADNNKGDQKALAAARELLARAEALKWTLPPRLGGVLALFEKNEDKVSGAPSPSYPQFLQWAHSLICNCCCRLLYHRWLSSSSSSQAGS